MTILQPQDVRNILDKGFPDVGAAIEPFLGTDPGRAATILGTLAGLAKDQEKEGFLTVVAKNVQSGHREEFPPTEIEPK